VIPMLGFPHEQWVRKVYICEPEPGLFVSALRYTMGEYKGQYAVRLRRRPVGTPQTEVVGSTPVEEKTIADSLIQVVAIIHHFINTYGGNQDGKHASCEYVRYDAA